MTTSVSDCSSVTWPSATWVMPGPLSWKNLSRNGRRRSRSTSTTRCPARASATARFAIVVDFPSCWTALVIMIVRASRSRVAKSRLVRSIRNDSASVARGSSIISRRFFARNCFRGTGRRPSIGSPPSRSPMSCAVRTRVSSASHRNASPTPRTIPSRMPRTTFRVVFGCICAAPVGVLDDRGVRGLERLHRRERLVAVDEARVQASTAGRRAPSRSMRASTVVRAARIADVSSARR